MKLKLFSILVFASVFPSLLAAHPTNSVRGYKCDLFDHGKSTEIRLFDPNNTVEVGLDAKLYTLNLHFASYVPAIVIDLKRDGKSVVDISGQRGAPLVDAVFSDINFFISCVSLK